MKHADTDDDEHRAPADDTLQSSIDHLYAAPYADFIGERDALAKQLRSTGDREAASQVKSLRKPSRIAWALNRIVHRRSEVFGTLEDAVIGIVDAHAGTGDVRAAMTTLRSAVRDYAVHAAEEARDEAMKLDVGDLSNGILAVLGNPTAWDTLRDGRLTDVPEAGGLDFLAGLPTRPRLEVSSQKAPAPAKADPGEVAAARKEARHTAHALEKARAAADAAAASLAESEADIASAEEQLRAVQAELKSALQRREFARRTKESTAAELRAAEDADRAAQRRLANLTSG